MLKLLFAKFKESFFSVVPIIILVLILNYTIAPMPPWSGSVCNERIYDDSGNYLFNLGGRFPYSNRRYVGSAMIKTKTSANNRFNVCNRCLYQYG